MAKNFLWKWTLADLKGYLREYTPSIVLNALEDVNRKVESFIEFVGEKIRRNRAVESRQESLVVAAECVRRENLLLSEDDEQEEEE